MAIMGRWPDQRLRDQLLLAEQLLTRRQAALALHMATLGLLLVSACILGPVLAESKGGGAQYQKTKFGMIYDLWQCDGFSGGTVKPYNIYNASRGLTPWGSPGEFHWWDEPAVGYYCYGATSSWPDIIKHHAELLREAKVDFIVLDITNWPNTTKYDAAEAIMRPLEEMLPIWNSVPGAPKIAQWTPLTSSGDMFAWVQQRLDQYPNLQFTVDGKPLAIVVATGGDRGAYPADVRKLAQFAAHYTLRSMWALSAYSPRMTASDWSFLEPCTSVAGPCNQRVATRSGTVEQVPVSAMYHTSYSTSNEIPATPKLQGVTFVRQFSTVFDNPSIRYAITSSWNEWISQRICLTRNSQPDPPCKSPGAREHWSDGRRVFTDNYDYELSRDIEPSRHAPYDYYYRLYKNCIGKFRQGQLCSASDIPYSAPEKVQYSPSSPIGFLDEVDCTHVGGWTQDPDVPTQSIAAVIYADGALLAKVRADGSRHDLCTARGSCNHAYYYATPAFLKDGREHTVRVYGADDANGSLTELSGSPKKLSCPAASTR